VAEQPEAVAVFSTYILDGGGNRIPVADPVVVRDAGLAGGVISRLIQSFGDRAHGLRSESPMC